MQFRAARFSSRPYGHVSAIGSITSGTDEPASAAGSAIERQVSGSPRYQLRAIIDVLRRGAEMQREHAWPADTQEQLGWHRRITVGPPDAVLRLEPVVAVDQRCRGRIDGPLPPRLCQHEPADRHAQ